MKLLMKGKIFIIGITLLGLTGCQNQSKDTVEFHISHEEEMENAKHISIEKNQVIYVDEKLKLSWDACGYYYSLGQGDIINLDKAPSREDDRTQHVELHIFRVDEYSDTTDLESLAHQAAGAFIDSDTILGTCHEEDKNRWNYEVLDEYTKEIALCEPLNRYEGKGIQCVKYRDKYDHYIVYQGYAITDGKNVVTFAASKNLGLYEDLNDYINPSCEEDNLIFQMCQDVINTIEMR